MMCLLISTLCCHVRIIISPMKQLLERRGLLVLLNWRPTTKQCPSWFCSLPPRKKGEGENSRQTDVVPINVLCYQSVKIATMGGDASKVY